MSYLHLYPELSLEEKVPPSVLFDSRQDILGKIRQVKRFDIIIIGGGIHGASLARLAAYQGLSVALFEQGDYACGTSSRSSKMAHGGLRYLELYDFAQVWEGVKARDELFQAAPYLVKPYPFLIPVGPSEWWFRQKLGVGLWLYDRFVKEKSRRHRWISQEKMPSFLQDRFAGGYEYTDGVLSDSRLVLENILSARQEGALCLNYASVEGIHSVTDGAVVKVKDNRSGLEFECRCGVVMNTAGPHVASVGGGSPLVSEREVAFSRGSHILFSTPWPHPALFLPIPGGRARYYFVWPHPGGTMVGTTERPVTEPDFDPTPSPDELEEIFERVEQDLPGSGLTRETAYLSFAGLRTLPLRPGATDVSQLSRRHRWIRKGSVLSLIGGKLTTAAATALDGLKLVYELASMSGTPGALGGWALPGGVNLGVQEFRAQGEAAGLSPDHLDAVLTRMGSRCRYLPADRALWDDLGDGFISAEVQLALAVEQAETLEDLLWRRLGVAYLPSSEIVAPKVAELMAKERPRVDAAEELARYTEHRSKLVPQLKR